MIATEAIEVVKWQQGIEFLAGVSFVFICRLRLLGLICFGLK